MWDLTYMLKILHPPIECMQAMLSMDGSKGPLAHRTHAGQC